MFCLPSNNWCFPCFVCLVIIGVSHVLSAQSELVFPMFCLPSHIGVFHVLSAQSYRCFSCFVCPVISVFFMFCLPSQISVFHVLSAQSDQCFPCFVCPVRSVFSTFCLPSQNQCFSCGAICLPSQNGCFSCGVIYPPSEDVFSMGCVLFAQVKNFGRSGRTKYTHLLDQDTTHFDSPWIADSMQNLKFHTSKGGGTKQNFERPSARTAQK